jgi:cyclopropane fatty-acyl-phospholipid synthase-like methyltransferase
MQVSLDAINSPATTLNYYDENADSLASCYESAAVSELQKLLIQTFPKNFKLLEIGCGSGRDAAFMAKNGYEVIAIDGSTKIINEAKKLHPQLKDKLFSKTLPNDLCFDEKFDGIYSIATLMHLSKDNLKKSVSRIYNLLNENGRLLMSISLFRDDIDENGFDGKGRFFLVLNFEEWVALLESHGFKNIKTSINGDGLGRDGMKWLTLIAQK